ncbi:MAG: hypothetical protein ACYTBJ_18135 [Planctomycetota bacterium]
MEKRTVPGVWLMIVVSAATMVWAGQTALQEEAEKLIAEGAVLEPINSVGESVHYVVDIGNGLFCGVTTERLKIFQKDNIENTICSYWLGGRYPRDMEYYRGYIYLVQPNEGLWIFDISSRWEFRLAAKLDIPLGAYADIEISGERLLYVDCHTCDLVVASLEEPPQPVEISRCALGGDAVSRYRCSMQIVDEHAYILGPKMLTVVDLGDIDRPVLQGGVHIEKAKGRGSVAVVWPYAYVHDNEDEKLLVYDVSNPAAMTLQTSVKTRGWHGRAVVRNVHVVTFGEGVHVHDITEPLKPVLARSHYNTIPGDFLISRTLDYEVTSKAKAVPLEGMPYFSRGQNRFSFTPLNIVVIDDFAYVFCPDTLLVFDVSLPAGPRYVGKLRQCYSEQAKVWVKDNYIFTPSEIIDISNAAKPRKVGSEMGRGAGTVVIGSKLVTAGGNSVNVRDVSKPAHAKFLKQIKIDKNITTLTAYDGIIYLGLEGALLRPCLLGDDLSLTTLGEIELGPADANTPMIRDMTAENGLLYACDPSIGIVVADIREPGDVQIVSRCDTVRPTRMQVADGVVYAVCGYRSVAIADMRRESNDKTIVTKPTNHASSVAACGNYVLVGRRENGITVFVSHPSSLR